mgnify:CR=1 FL=1
MESVAKERARMVDVSEKVDSLRVAVAEGFIRLRRRTIEAILSKEVAKGDVIAVANVAGVMAVKKTPELIPMCHQIPITSAEFDFEVLENGIRVTCKVKAFAKTGVEMEALSGVAAALLTIWDMVKSFEKDETGNYPETSIEKIVLLEKKVEQRNPY